MFLYKSHVKHMVGVATLCGLHFVGCVYAVLTAGAVLFVYE